MKPLYYPSVYDASTALTELIISTGLGAGDDTPFWHPLSLAPGTRAQQSDPTDTEYRSCKANKQL